MTSTMLPEFIIIGAQKSGSTFIQDCVSDHPQVYMPEGETPFFEDPDYGEGDIGILEQLDRSKPTQKFGIKRPSYLSRPECPGRIKKHLPNAKLIMILRHPVERFLSAYFHHIRDGFFPTLAVRKGIDGLLSGQMAEKYPRSPEIIEFGLYANHIRRYLDNFNRDQLLVLWYDDLKADNIKVIREIYRFLEIDPTYVPGKVLNSRPQKVVYSLPRLKWLRLQNGIKYEYCYNRKRLRLKEVKGLKKWLCVANEWMDYMILSRFFANKKPTLGADDYQRLLAVYLDDIKALESLLEKDLKHWYQT